MIFAFYAVHSHSIQPFVACVHTTLHTQTYLPCLIKLYSCLHENDNIPVARLQLDTRRSHFILLSFSLAVDRRRRAVVYVHSILSLCCSIEICVAVFLLLVPYVNIQRHKISLYLIGAIV